MRSEAVLEKNTVTEKLTTAEPLLPAKAKQSGKKQFATVKGIITITETIFKPVIMRELATEIIQKKVFIIYDSFKDIKTTILPRKTYVFIAITEWGVIVTNYCPPLSKLLLQK